MINLRRDEQNVSEIHYTLSRTQRPTRDPMVYVCTTADRVRVLILARNLIVVHAHLRMTMPIKR